VITKFTKWIVIMCLSLCFVALACAFGFIVLQTTTQGQAPIRSLRVTINPSQREELFGQFQKFADKHGFEVVISDYGTGFESYVVEMQRDYIQIAAMHNSHDREIVEIGFYDETRATPVADKTIDTIDELIIDLKNFISEIPNVTVTEKK
jgi:hypothetical protein